MKIAGIKKVFVSKITFIFILTVALFSFTSIIIAEELSLEKAIKLGKKNNYEIEQKRETIKDLERQRDIIEADIDWKLGYTGNYFYNTGGPSFDSEVIDEGDKITFTIEGEKTTLSSLSIKSKISLQALGPFENDEKNFEINLSKRLYPFITTQAEKDFIQTDKQIIINKAELAKLENRKEVDWLESYLKLLYLGQSLEYNKISYQLAYDELSLVKAKLEIGEAGLDQVLMAEISLQEVKLEQDQLITGIKQVEDKLAMEFGLTKDSVLLKESDKYLNRFIKKVDSININTINEGVINLIKNNNIKLREIMLNKKYAEKELEWQLQDDDIEVNTFGSYNYNSDLSNSNKDNLQIGIGISYDFYDGGRQESLVENIKAKIINLDKEYEYALEQFILELRGMLNEQNINSIRLSSTVTGLEKAKLIEKLYRDQYNEGLIVENQYKQKLLAVNQAELAYREAQDQLLLAKLRIALFLGLY